MEDVIYFLIMAAIMVGGAVSSANKKKKQREAASRQQSRTPPVSDEPELEMKTVVRKSLSEILEEISRNDTTSSVYEDTSMQEEDNFDYQITPSFEHAGRITENLAFNESFRHTSHSATPTIPDVENDEYGKSDMDDVLGGNFDLRRAVIESEILNPKFKQF